MKERNIGVEYLLLDTTVKADAAVSSVQAPKKVGEGETITIEGTIYSTLAQKVQVTLSRNGIAIAKQEIDAGVGDTTVSFTDTPEEAGSLSYELRVSSDLDDRPQNDTGSIATTIEGSSKILLVEGNVGDSAELAKAFEAGGLLLDKVTVEKVPSLDRLRGYKSIVLVNVPVTALSEQQAQDIKTATETIGTGLVTVGGDRTYGVGGYRNSPLEDVLPVVSDVLDPTKKLSLAQVIAVDTSGSMADQQQGGPSKIEIVRVASTKAFSSLQPGDEAGLLGTDTRSRWILDLQEKPSDQVLADKLGKLSPDGGTDLSDIIPKSKASLQKSDAGLKHIIIFSDGFTGPDVLAAMAEQAEKAKSDGITVSVVATGVAAAGDMAPIAAAGGGRFYPVQDLNLLPEILVEETVIASRNFITEGEFFPEISGSSPSVSQLDEAPPLYGYVATTDKPEAKTLLRLRETKDPLLVTWQAGLGRSTAWTSDASSRWSSAWVGWEGYVTFWNTVVRETFPVNTSASVRSTLQDDEVAIRAEASGADVGNVEATVIAPSGNRSTVVLQRTSKGVFEAVTPLEEPGTYAVNVTSGSGEEKKSVGSDVVTLSYAAEYQPTAPDEALLQRVSEITGGRGKIVAAQAFDEDGLVAGKLSRSIAGALLLFAMLVWLVAAYLSRFWFAVPSFLQVRLFKKMSRKVGSKNKSSRSRALDKNGETSVEAEAVPLIRSESVPSNDSFVAQAKRKEPEKPEDHASSQTVQALLKAKKE